MVTPSPVGLYDPAFEHDACGVGFVAQLSGQPSHDIVAKGLTALGNMDHRGATGRDPQAGDGAGILLQVPDGFLRQAVDFELPEAGAYAMGMAFLPNDPRERATAKRTIEYIAIEERLSILGWRVVPTRTDTLSPISLGTMPHFEQLFVASEDGARGIDLDRRVYPLRNRARNEARVYFASLSARTTIYKGMLTTSQLSEVFPDLLDERIASALALFHSRFSTNTFPTWDLSHPYRMIAHTGEINTVKGNRNWMSARESMLATDLIPGDLNRIFPICTPGGSDSASFDEVLELLHLGGRSLPHAVLMMIPEAWDNHAEMDPARRDFYRFHSALMEPWDGPASVNFTDGTLIGAVLDRNGLRPGRYWVTDDGLVVFASEAGVLPIDPAKVVQKGRMKPGKMLLVDLERHRLIDDDEIKAKLAADQPYGEWLQRGRILLDNLPERQHVVYSHASVERRQQVFGYSREELKVLIAPMANNGAEPIGSMGNDTPLAVLADRPRLLFDYFTQLFAQVTNPPLDAIREELVTSMKSILGTERNLLAPGPDSCHNIVIDFPVLTSDQLAKIVRINRDGHMPAFDTHVLRGLYDVEGGGAALEEALDRLCQEALDAIAGGARTLVLSDRHSNAERAPIPSLLLVSAIHNFLTREKKRTQVSLIVEAGDVREVHHVALLLGYGAAAVNPYLCFETAEDLARREWFVNVKPDEAVSHVRKALGKGVLKILSKMGVSTVSSYTGAMIFEAIGLRQDLVDKYFTGTVSRIEGIGLEEIAAEVAARHTRAYPPDGVKVPYRALTAGGDYKWRREGQPHLFDPETIFRLQQATREGRYDIFKKYTDRVNDQAERMMTLRGLLEFDSDRKPVPIAEVEPVSQIVKRFATGAMSYGSISQEAHENLAIAMNILGAKSNTGEGGEDPQRLHDPSRRSAIKQVASGRFGVTSEYLVNADDLQIKMAQGAKPGEGGQLPGGKVWPWIAKTRHSTPGVGLISPPPHHDIYSIEDLKQLIHDLKCANPQARVHVKLVAEVGVGTVAAGVSKAKADVVLISGHDGGTGAAPLNSIKHAGGPWELGLAETQQTLVMNGLRDRIVVQVDGQLKTGRDVVIAALLGAEEFGFATAPLVVSGCVLMRACQLDTCPVGVATQDPRLREKFTGQPEQIVRFFEFIGQEVREILAEQGFRSIAEAVGHVEVLKARKAEGHWKAHGLDLAPILEYVPGWEGDTLYQSTSQDHELETELNRALYDLAGKALAGGPVHAELKVRNVDRTVGTLAGYRVTKETGGAGLPPDSLHVTLRGTGGQSFGAFLPRGITLRLIGDSNDYFGKGLSGGRLILRPDEQAPFPAEDNIIAGNVIAYGATSGELYIRGQVGERFCVRNSGAAAVVEGVGDHACEYMTGGRVLIIGPTGRNLAAGMSGGVAWVLDLQPVRLNPELVDALSLEDADLAEVLELLRRHEAETGSPVAAGLLALPPETLRARLTKIMPRDYARVLAAQAKGKEEGLSEEEITALMMEASHG
ncbi:MAG: glutamate synthase large subunit [Propionibacteriaceae bacterium]|jgi:glutamate synthase (NADPH/NADH) large chain|nr:glutamate synthase large subunit [Propionibacteriaceae bacterium]